jgi:RNA polymerase sigma factor (sigma-70 family)
MSVADSGLIRFRTHFRREVRRDAERRLRRDPYAALVCEAQLGDREALSQLLRLLAPRLRGAVRAVFGGEHADVDDVLQEALLSFLRALPAFEGRSTVLHYAYRITVRTGLLARRRTRRRLDRVELHESPELMAEGVASDPLAERRRDVLRSLLDELPEAQAETMALRVCLGMSLEEVSEATDAPVNTVRSRVRLARQALRQRLEDDPDAHDLLDGWV